MNSDPLEELEKTPAFCSNCRKKIEKGKEYHYNIKVSRNEN
jgi:hypothetical protein